MVNVMIEVSKYLMILLMAVYTYWNFNYFRFHEEYRQNRVCAKQTVVMLLVHFAAYVILLLKSGDERMILLYLAQLVFLLTYTGLYRLFYRNASRILVNNMCMLLCVGFIMLTRISYEKSVRQFLVVAVSALVTWIIPFIMDRVWQLSRIPWLYGVLGLAFLIAVWLAFHQYWRISFSAVRVCKNQFCIFYGDYVLPFHRC